MAPGENLPENRRQIEFFSTFFCRIWTPVFLPLSFNLLTVAESLAYVQQILGLLSIHWYHFYSIPYRILVSRPEQWNLHTLLQHSSSRNQFHLYRSVWHRLVPFPSTYDHDVHTEAGTEKKLGLMHNRWGLLQDNCRSWYQWTLGMHMREGMTFHWVQR